MLLKHRQLLLIFSTLLLILDTEPILIRSTLLFTNTQSHFCWYLQSCYLKIHILYWYCVTQTHTHTHRVLLKHSTLLLKNTQMEAYWYVQPCYIKINILSTSFDTINPVIFVSNRVETHTKHRMSKSLVLFFINVSWRPFNEIICASSRLRSENSHNWHSARDNYPHRHWGLHKHDKIQDQEGLKPEHITILITAQAESLCCMHTVTGSASCPHCCFLILRSINHSEVGNVLGNHRRGRKWIDQVEKKVTLYHLGWKWAKALHDVSPIRGSLLWLKNRFVWRSSLHIKSDLSSLNQRGWSHTHSRHSQTCSGTWRLDFMPSYKPDAWIVPLIWQDCNYELMLMKSHTRLQLLALVGMWCLDNHLR